MNGRLGSVSGPVVSMLAAWFLALSAGCSSQSPNGAPGGPADTGPAAAPPGLSCLQILKCIAACPDSDAKCPDACAESGTTEGKTSILALAGCVETESCTNATCVQEKCGASLDQCVTSSTPPPAGSPLAGSAPPGSVPADLVGTWSGARNGLTERLSLNADGSGEWMTSDVSEYVGCLSFTRTIRSGNVVVGATAITMYATSVVQSVQRCTPPATNTNQPAATEMLRWHRDEANSYHEADPNVIFIIDEVCAAKYPGKEDCNTAGCPIGLYCTSRLKRE